MLVEKLENTPTCYGKYNWKTGCLTCLYRSECLNLAKEAANKEYQKEQA